MSKLKVGISTSYPFARTGFSRNAQSLLPYLYKTGKYELFLLAHSMQDNHPDLGRAPWKTEGVFRNFDQQRFNVDEGYKRFVAYGNTATEEFVLKNKLDVFIAAEDGWAFQPEFFFNKPWFNHINKNFLLWTTIDSIPILSLYKEWAEKIPQMWVWASFAEREMKLIDAEKYKHTKTVHGTLDVTKFYPIPSQEKQQLREKFNIKQDEIIIIYLGRSQLRKHFCANLEALAKLRKQNPNYKVKLLFHCHWAEPMGWPLDRVREEVGLKKEDVLCTYNCMQCGYWGVRPYEGEYKDCNQCGIKGGTPNQQAPGGTGQITAGVTSSITEEDLSKVYGICDGSCSVFTSGGLEYTNVESLLCGLPLASSPYSSGEDFVKNDFVYKINGYYFRECQTAFKKFTPEINDIYKFFKWVHDTPLAKRQEISRRGREWALKTFDIKVIGPKFEEFLDSCSPIDWEAYEIQQKANEVPKNPLAVIPHIEDNATWIKRLYKDILNMEVDEKDGGYQNWMGVLSQGTPRENVEQFFKRVAIDKNLEINKFSFESFFDNTGRKRILFVLPQSAGDIIWATALFPNAKILYPDYDFYFACDPKYFGLLEGNPHVHKTIPYQPQFDNLLFLEGAKEHKGLVDIAFLLHAPTQRFLTYLHNVQDKTQIDLLVKKRDRIIYADEAKLNGRPTEIMTARVQGV